MSYVLTTYYAPSGTSSSTTETGNVASLLGGESGRAAVFAAAKTESGDVSDFSAWVGEMHLVHNDEDGKDAGRDVKSGKMKRAYITNKHTLNFTLIDKVPPNVAHDIFALIHTSKEHESFYVWFQSPCYLGVVCKNVYCSSVDYGSQRYDRKSDQCYYYGMKFNLIEM